MHLGFSQDDTRTSPDFAAAGQPPGRIRQGDQTIFEASCVKCHGRGKAKGSFSLENRAAFLKVEIQVLRSFRAKAPTAI